MAVISEVRVRSVSAMAGARAAIGLGQGVGSWLLYETSRAHAWPATEPYLFAALVFAVGYVPVLAVLGLGSLRRGVLASWLGGALGLVVAVALHEAARAPAPAGFEPRAEIAFALALALGIGHALVAAGSGERRPIAAYPIYFDLAWKLALQLALAALFLGLSWLVLWLGAELFRLINLDFLQNLIEKPGFAMPASGLAFACGLHLTDVRVGLVQGMRNVQLVLLSWLLPVATGLIVAFLASLPFTGLQPLWHTSHGSQLLLTAAGLLVVLINTAYRDGVATPPPPALLRWAGSVAALCLPVLVAIAAHGVALRIGQHGWTAYRVFAAAWLLVTGVYAAGYAWAAVAGRPWLRPVGITNIVGAFAVLAATIALTTAIADPDRLAVADQVARLEAGRVTPETFDFKYLRFHSGRYGRQALELLKSAKLDAIRERAAKALAMQAEYGPSAPAHAGDLAAIPVFPTGQTLPESLVKQDWANDREPFQLPQCLRFAASKCEAFIGGGLVLIAEIEPFGRAVAMQQDAGGSWRPIGNFPNFFRCDRVHEAMRAGAYHWVAPMQRDVEAAGLHLTMQPAAVNAVKCR